MAAQLISILRVPAYSTKFMPKIRRAVVVALKEQTTESPDFIPRRRLNRAGGVSDLSPVVQQYGICVTALRDTSARRAFARCADACINSYIYSRKYVVVLLCIICTINYLFTDE